MVLSMTQIKEMGAVALPLMEWLKKNCHPHCEAQVNSDGVTILEGLAFASKKGSFISPREGEDHGDSLHDRER